jgi:peptidoglycan/xylan/chitin deacetylase (PgdA/CDA1 family)
MIPRILGGRPVIPIAAFSSGGAILCFHSITTSELPAAGDAHVSLEQFRGYVRVARRLGRLVPLGELLRRHAQGQSTGGLIAITLDDAYAALGREVREIISREAIPITVFVVSESAATGGAYWWDRVDDLFPLTPAERWRAFETACGVPDAYRRKQPPEHGPLRPLRQWVLAKYRGRWPIHLEPVLAALEHEIGLSTRHRSMTFDELAGLAAMPEVEIGVHTASHPVLPFLSTSDLEREILGCYADLRERFESVLPVLAIPFGLFDERTMRAASSVGMIASLTLSGDTLAGYAGRHALPRICLTRRDTCTRLGMRILALPRLKRRCFAQTLTMYPALPSAST